MSKASRGERAGGFLALRPLRHRSFAIVWTAALISTVGTWMETVAVGDLVANRTGEAGWTALVAAAGFLPMGLLGPIGGAIADRVDRRRFLFTTTTLQMLCAGALAALSASGRATPLAVTGVVFVAGCVGGISFPAYTAMMPDLVPPEDLLGAMSLGQAQFNMGRVVGPAFAGLVIAGGSYTWAFALNTVSFAALLVAYAGLHLPPPVAPGDDAGIWARIRVGAGAARKDPGISSAILLIAVVALTASPFIALIPAMARVRFDGGPELTSILVTAQGVGAVAGALAVPGIAARFGRRRVLTGALVALPAALMLYGAAPTPALATVALAGVGATYICVLSGSGTVVQLRAPAELRARLVSLFFLALGTLYPLGALVQGPISDRVGLGVTTAAGGAALLAVVVFLRLFRPQRLLALDDLDAYPAPPGGDPPVSPPGPRGTSPVAERRSASAGVTAPGAARPV